MSSAKSPTRSAHRSFSWSKLESPEVLAELARFVREGGVVVFPTESSYALGADPTSAAGVAAVFRIKGRPADKPLPVVVAGSGALASLGVEEVAEGLPVLARAWPGPLTVILPLRKPLAAACGRSELAVRVPGHRRLRELLARMEIALTATSANLAGGAPLLETDDVSAIAGDQAVWMIDDGRLPGGPPSTLVRLTGKRVSVVRQGAMSIARLRALAPQLEFGPGFSASAVEIPVDGSG